MLTNFGALGAVVFLPPVLNEVVIPKKYSIFAGRAGECVDGSFGSMAFWDDLGSR